MPMSSMAIKSARQMRATTLGTEASTLARAIVAVSDSKENQATRRPASIAAWPSASQKWLLPVPLVTAADCTRFGQSAAKCAHYLASSRTRRSRAGSSWLAAHRRRDPSPGHTRRRQRGLSAGRMDQLVRDPGRRKFRASAEPRLGARLARGSAAARCPTPAPGRREGEVGSPPNSANHSEVSPLQNHTIAPARQLRLVLPETEGVWPEDVWDSLPEEIHREVLARIARLLSRWFEARRQP